MSVHDNSRQWGDDFSARVVRIIASQDEDLDEKRIIPSATLSGLGFDSFGAVSLMFALEEEFHVEISDEMLKGIKTVDDVISGLRRLCGHT